MDRITQKLIEDLDFWCLKKRSKILKRIRPYSWPALRA
jgi:hypothetical protein